jgi:signal transduction histidine kinase
MVIFQIIDISDSILYDQSKAENEFLSLMNATVSHELRNPLNSICAENIHKENLLKELRETLNDKNISIKELIKKCL